MNWSDVGKTLRNIAGDSLPAIGTALGGPAGAVVGEALSHVLGTDSTPDAVAAALNPQSLIQLKQIEANLQVAQIQADSAAATGQLAVNKVEAGNASIWVSGGRPAVIWVCAASFAWTFLFQPIVACVVAIMGLHVTLPVLDNSAMMPVLTGLLGLGGMRTFEKLKGVNGQHG
jgi:hypothetical protein